MRPCVLCIYWTLLLISMVSSGLLFLIIASEGAQVEDSSFPPEKNNTYEAYDNITLNYDNHNSFQSSAILDAKIQTTAKLKTDRNIQYPQKKITTVSANIKPNTNNDEQERKNVDVLAESLTQQPNLSQGISDTGQTVVLTIVDTAAAELQNLAEPKIDHELSSTSSVKNSSLLSGNKIRQSEHLKSTVPTTQIPAPPTLDETTDRPNETDIAEEISTEEVNEFVLTVRAEQKMNADRLESRIEEEVGQEPDEELSPKIDSAFTTASELNDTAARAQLVGDIRDETAAVILDGLVTSGPTDPHEDIPSFSEWAQKRLEEAEKKKTHPNASLQTPGNSGRSISGMKVRSKNYASPDCGAKVVAANPETNGAKNVLVSTRDEYMLNACKSRIWFVVELCEAIQAKKIELANFELFSSSPKDFSVYVSDRFPTKDWSPVGQFTAKDVKDTQSFVLHPHFFGKFIKVELQSHYGSEHFCPVSLFRAYGTSEFEVLETETENQTLQETRTDEDDDEEDSDEEELLDSEDDDPPRNLFGSARDAVLRIVKKAAEVLVKSSDLTGNNITEIQQSIDDGNILDTSYTSCTTPRYTILCDNCTDHKFASVFQLVSCRDRQLDSLLRIDLVNETLRRGKLCGLHGVEIESLEEKKETQLDDATNFNLAMNLQTIFLASIFKSEYIVALCNVLATKERKVVMNTSYEISVNNSENTAKDGVLSVVSTTDYTLSEVTSHRHASATCTQHSNSPACKSTASSKEIRRRPPTHNVSEETEDINIMSIETSASTSKSLASQIKPTKTLGKEDVKKESSVPILEPSKEPTEETLQPEMLTTVPPPSNPTPTLKIAEELLTLETSVKMTSQIISSVPSMNLDSQEASDTLSFDMENIDTPVQSKTDKLENGEQDKKQVKDPDEQEVRLSSQDHLALDTLLSDLKDLEGDTQNGASSSSSMAQPTASTIPQKESVFLRLSNRIKALERNMSLSGQYLEELSRRYKKQVEEMQRSLERAVTAMGEESRKDEEREAKRVEEIAALRKQIDILSKLVENLLYDGDSWRSRISTIIQHVLLICLEVITIILVFSYCRRGESVREEGKFQSDANKSNARRKSAENFNSHATKKTKKRRPSEIASHISSTYHELMIDDRPHETKKERKKKRKREATVAGTRVVVNTYAKQDAVRYKSVLNVIPSGTKLPSRRASSIESPCFKESQDLASKRPDSAPEAAISWFDDQTKRGDQVVQPIPKNKVLEIQSESNSEFVDHRVDKRLSESNLSSLTIDRSVQGSIANERKLEASKNGSFRTGGILKSARLSSPSFMKTALGTRSKRKISSSSNEKWESSQDSEHSYNRSSPSTPTGVRTLSQSISDSVNGSAANGLIGESDESRSATPTSAKKEKKSTGLKKMVRKFF